MAEEEVRHEEDIQAKEGGTQEEDEEAPELATRPPQDPLFHLGHGRIVGNVGNGVAGTNNTGTT